MRERQGDIPRYASRVTRYALTLLVLRLRYWCCACRSIELYLGLPSSRTKLPCSCPDHCSSPLCQIHVADISAAVIASMISPVISTCQRRLPCHAFLT